MPIRQLSFAKIKSFTIMGPDSSRFVTPAAGATDGAGDPHLTAATRAAETGRFSYRVLRS